MWGIKYKGMREDERGRCKGGATRKHCEMNHEKRLVAAFSA